MPEHEGAKLIVKAKSHTFFTKSYQDVYFWLPMWVKIYKDKEIPESILPIGSSIPVKLVDQRLNLCLGRNAQGYFTVSNECTHARAALAKGKVTDRDEIICPLHGYRFNLKTGRETSGNGCADIEVFEIKRDETGFWVWVELGYKA